MQDPGHPKTKQMMNWLGKWKTLTCLLKTSLKNQMSNLKTSLSQMSLVWVSVKERQEVINEILEDVSKQLTKKISKALGKQKVVEKQQNSSDQIRILKRVSNLNTNELTSFKPQNVALSKPNLSKQSNEKVLKSVVKSVDNFSSINSSHKCAHESCTFSRTPSPRSFVEHRSCYYCKRIGHITKHCPTLSNQIARKRESKQTEKVKSPSKPFQNNKVERPFVNQSFQSRRN